MADLPDIWVVWLVSYHRMKELIVVFCHTEFCQINCSPNVNSKFCSPCVKKEKFT